MGIIQKQTIKGTFISYLGVLVGFLTTAIIIPRILTTDEIGLVNLLVSFSVLFAQAASLGFNSVTNRLFPYFRNNKGDHNGFIFIALIVSIVGFIIVFISFEFYKPVLIRNNIKDSALLVDYINYIIPLIFFTLFFNLFDSYTKAIYDAVIGTFLKEFLQRVFVLISVSLYFFSLITLPVFIILYVISLSTPTVILFIILIIRGQFRLSFPGPGVITKKMSREMINLCFFGIISGFSTLAILHIDRILVNKFLGISETGIYATNFFFATLIIIPSRSLIKISTTIIADSWKSGSLDNILFVYRKSVINQGIISLLIFVGLWVNINNIYQIIPPEFEAGKWVIFYGGLANVITMLSGVSGTIILTSESFRIHTVFILIFLASLVGLNYILIPFFGLAGAAMATALASLIFNSLRIAYVFRKFGMNPYNFKTPVLLMISISSYLIASLLPQMHYIYDIIIRSALVVVIFLPSIYFLRVSEDLNVIVNNFTSRLKK